MERKPLETIVVGLPEASATGMAIMIDVLSSVGRSWEMLHGLESRPPAFCARLLSLDGEPFQSTNGLMMVPHGRLGDCMSPDIVIIPEVRIGPSRTYPESFFRIADWIRTMHANGALIASVCSGSLIVAESGLLDGEDAATHWAVAAGMAERYPRVRVRKERILVPAGQGHRVVTAGGASSWHDLLLYLIGRFCGWEEARRIARVFLLQWHAEGQLPFASLTIGRQHQDQVVAASQIWAADNYRNANPVSEMVARSGLTERSFLRRFRSATGQSPLEYVQTLRIEEAKQMLETSTLSLDDIAAEIGYIEPASFRRLFRKMVGMTPSDYRRRHAPPPEVWQRAMQKGRPEDRPF